MSDSLPASPWDQSPWGQLLADSVVHGRAPIAASTACHITGTGISSACRIRGALPGSLPFLDCSQHL
jgi:hypothetical protein